MRKNRAIYVLTSAKLTDVDTKMIRSCSIAFVSIFAATQGFSTEASESSAKLKDTASPTLEASAYVPDPAKLTVCKYRWDEKFGRYVHGGYLTTPLDINTLMQPVMPLMQRFQQALALKGTKLVVMPVSPDYTVYSSLWNNTQKTALLSGFDPQSYAESYERYELGLAKISIPSIDILSLAKKSEKAGKPFYFRWDRHWNSDGAELAAKETARVILKAFPALSVTFPAPTFQFESQIPLNVNGGILNDELNTCGVKNGNIQVIKDAQQEHTRLTRAVAIQGGGLLEDPSYPVVVVGTSLSRLSGSSAVAVPLAQALNTNVLDASVVAGGPFGSLIWYFGTEGAWKSRPKIIVWESEANGEAPISATGFRQIIPAVYGPCSDKLLLASGIANLRSTDSVTVLNASKKQQVQGHHFYINLTISDPAVVKFNVRFVDHSGQSESIDIERTTRVPNSGIFFLELGDNSKQPLERIEVRPFEASTALITASLCHDPLGAI